jgi:hypothetical protein
VVNCESSFAEETVVTKGVVVVALWAFFRSS